MGCKVPVTGLEDAVIACVGGGSNAIGIFSAFLEDKEATEHLSDHLFEPALSMATYFFHLSLSAQLFAGLLDFSFARFGSLLAPLTRGDSEWVRTKWYTECPEAIGRVGWVPRCASWASRPAASMGLGCRPPGEAANWEGAKMVEPFLGGYKGKPTFSDPLLQGTSPFLAEFPASTHREMPCVLN